ncbi:hypothetical protein PO124_09225 [Bacillus licheniformis]|nr:hypothetical protein [Bacillus licheniformis]
MFIYELIPPLRPDEFFQDGMLNVFLYNRVGKARFQQLKEYFPTRLFLKKHGTSPVLSMKFCICPAERMEDVRRYDRSDGASRRS